MCLRAGPSVRAAFTHVRASRAPQISLIKVAEEKMPIRKAVEYDYRQFKNYDLQGIRFGYEVLGKKK